VFQHYRIPSRGGGDSMIVAIFKKEASWPKIAKRNLIVLNLIWIRQILGLFCPDADDGLGGVRN
jgi:hypothetical protein